MYGIITSSNSTIQQLRSYMYILIIYVYLCTEKCQSYMCMHINIIIDISVLVGDNRGPCSKYDISIEEGNFKGKLEVIWGGEPLKVRRCVAVEYFKLS